MSFGTSSYTPTRQSAEVDQAAVQGTYQEFREAISTAASKYVNYLIQIRPELRTSGRAAELLMLTDTELMQCAEQHILERIEPNSGRIRPRNWRGQQGRQRGQQNRQGGMQPMQAILVPSGSNGQQVLVPTGGGRNR